jgi:Cys-tRNA(Pro)/Cys-tRNA(Cys) deacylase
MTMPMRILEGQGVPYAVRLQSSKQVTAEGVAEDLGVPVGQVLKAMIVQRSGARHEGRFVLFVISGDRRLSLKKAAAALDEKSVEMAQERDVQRVTGYQVGAVSVLGFRRDDVASFVDRQVLNLDQVIISAGRPDMGLALNPEDMLKAIGQAQIGDFSEEE